MHLWKGEGKTRRCRCAGWDERLGANDQRRRFVFRFIWLGHDTPTTDIARYCCCAQLVGGAGKILDEAQVVGGTECQSACQLVVLADPESRMGKWQWQWKKAQHHTSPFVGYCTTVCSLYTGKYACRLRQFSVQRGRHCTATAAAKERMTTGAN